MPPEIARGSLEQAVYTWSTVNVTGKKGQGYGAISPGLTGEVPWLERIDSDHFRLLDHGLQFDTDGFPGWRASHAIGSWSLRGTTAVYRKLASVGLDAERRNRSLVHIIFGNSEEFDLSRISEDSSVWLSADSCPLDKLPRLATLDLATIRARTLEHECVKEDGPAWELLEQLDAQGAGVELRGIPADDLVRRLLIACPSQLWSSLGIDWYVGRDAAVAAVSVNGSLNPRRPDVAGLRECDLHIGVESLWDDLPERQQSWNGFYDAAIRPRSAAAVCRPETPEAPIAWQAQLAATTGGLEWPEAALTEQQCLQAVALIRQWSLVSTDWLDKGSPKELRALFGGVERRESAHRVARALIETLPPDHLARAWKRSGLATLGLAAVLSSSFDPPAGWVVSGPKSSEEVAKLVGWLQGNEADERRLASFTAVALRRSPVMRSTVLDGYRSAGWTARQFYGRMIPMTELSDAPLLEVIRDDFDQFADWLGLPEPVAEALRRGLARPKPRRLSLRAALGINQGRAEP